MAQNPYVNKVVFGSATLVDLTGTTATADKILQGYGAYGADGAWMDGTAQTSGEDGYVWQDQDGYVHLSDEEGTGIIVNSLTVNGAGTYTAPTQHAYSPVTVLGGSATTPATSVTANPSVSVNSSGLITATVSATKSVTPSVSEGWVASGTAGTVTVSGTNTSQLSTQAATAITPTESQQTAVAAGKYTTGAVTVDAIPSTYVGSGIDRRTGSSLYVMGDQVLVPSGYYADNTAATVSSGTEGTPIATKGAVSNHSVTVTPSVTNTTGYISGGTKTGTPVTVSASELVSGSQTITENGTVNVANLAEVVVDVDTSPKYTATVGALGAYRNYIYYDDVRYSADSSFEFSAGDSCTIEVWGEMAGADIYEDGVKIGESDTNVTYTYILPGCDIEIVTSGSGGSARVDITKESPASITVEPLSVTTNGTYTAPSGTAYSPVTVNVPSGGGGTGGNMSDPIRFFDYDGTLVASYSAVPSALPSVPLHSGLTDSTWNYTLAQVTEQFNAMGTCDVGANYITESGDTEIDIELHNGRLSPYLSFAPNGTVEIDWGDGSSMDTITGTSLTTRKSIQHVYSAAGAYTITLHVTSGSFAFYGTNVYSLLNANFGTANANRVYSNSIQKIRIGADVSIGTYAFTNCCSLVSISIPSGVTSIGTYAFRYCYSLSSISIPSGVTSIGGNAFNGCPSLASISIPSGVTSIESYTFGGCSSLSSISMPSGVTSIGGNAFTSCSSLVSISIPSGVTSIGTYVFNSCYSLSSISIPSGVTSIGTNMFSSCYSLSSISIPSGVTSIGSNAFSSCYGMAEYHFAPTTPPTLANTNAFTNIQSDCVIYVPSDSLEAYQTAENWSTYASYMVGE